MVRMFLVGCAGVLGLILSTCASAATTPATTTFQFSGLCTDCTGLGTATLVLTGYTPYASGQTPTSFDASNFVSLTYSSNLIQFTLDNATRFGYSTYANGSLGILPGFYPVSIGGVDPDFNNFDTFQSNSDGTWKVTKEGITFDVGTLGTWNALATTPGTGSVPEPATWGMMILGFGAVGFAMRRRNVITKVKFA